MSPDYLRYEVTRFSADGSETETPPTINTDYRSHPFRRTTLNFSRSASEGGPYSVLVRRTSENFLQVFVKATSPKEFPQMVAELIHPGETFSVAPTLLHPGISVRLL